MVSTGRERERDIAPSERKGVDRAAHLIADDHTGRLRRTAALGQAAAAAAAVVIFVVDRLGRGHADEGALRGAAAAPNGVLEVRALVCMGQTGEGRRGVVEEEEGGRGREKEETCGVGFVCVFVCVCMCEGLRV